MKTQFKWLLPLLVLTSHNATAATATANLGVTATVSATCTLTTTPVAFGTYNPASGSITTTSGAVSVTCTTGTTYSIALDPGANASSSGDPKTRRMKAGTANYLPYTLYLESAHTNIWGDGTQSTVVNPITGTFTGNGTQTDYSVYGVITAGQYVPVGSYADTVVATVTYN